MAADTPITITGTGEEAVGATKRIKELEGALKSYKDAAIEASGSFKFDFDTLDKFKSQLNGLTDSYKNITNLTGDQRIATSALTVGLLKAKEAFTGLSKVDTTGLNTFSSQLSMVTKAGKMSEPLLRSLAAKFGPVGKAVNIAADQLGAYVTNLAMSADNAMRLQNATLQLGAATGDLDKIYGMAGDKLQNMTAFLDMHQSMISKSSDETGVAQSVVAKYYEELGSIPGALASIVNPSGAAGDKMSMLSATMKLAAGTGRSYSDIMGDLNTAYKNYGLVGEKALTFSAQMGKVANNLGTELSIVKNALTETSGRFSMFAGNADQATKMATGFANILNTYGSALTSTGVGGNVAIDIVKNMTAKMGDLTIAQKAFLSGQTGGPGGLMGSFQIGKMLKEDPAKVFEKVRQSMMKQFGSLVSEDDAAKGPQAAAQMTKQMTMLKSGPLGQFARTDQEAIKILESFKAKGEGKVSTKEMSDNILKEGIDRGTDLQSKSYTVLTEIRNIMEAQSGFSAIQLKKLAEDKLTAGGSEDGASEDIKNMKSHLKKTMSAKMSSEDEGVGWSGASKSGFISGEGKLAANALNRVNPMSDKGAATYKAGRDMITGIASSMIAYFKGKETEINRMPLKDRATPLKELKSERAKWDSELSSATKSATPASTKVAKAVMTGTAPKTDDKTKPKEKPKVEVTVKGMCIKCGKEADEGSVYASDLSPATEAGK